MKRFASPAALHNVHPKSALDEEGCMLAGRHVYLRLSQWDALNKLAAKARTTPFNALGNLIDIAAQAAQKPQST